MNDNQYDEDPIFMKPINNEKNGMFSIPNNSTERPKRAATKKKINYDDFYENNSNSRTRKRNSKSGGGMLYLIIFN